MLSHRWVALLVESPVSQIPSSVEISVFILQRMPSGNSSVQQALLRMSELPWARTGDLEDSAMSSSKSLLVHRRLWNSKVNFLMEEEFVWISLRIIDAVVAVAASVVVVAVAASVVAVVAASVAVAVAASVVVAVAASVVDVVAASVDVVAIAVAVVAEEALLTLPLWQQTKAPCSNMLVPRFHSEHIKASERLSTDFIAGVVGMSIDGVLCVRNSLFIG